MEAQVVTTIDDVNVSEETKVTFTRKGNPKRDGSKAAARFAKYMKAKTVGEYLELGGTKADLKYDHAKGFVELEGVERAE